MAYAALDLHFEAGLVSRCRGPFDLLVGPPGSGKSAKGRGLVRTFNARPSVKQPIRFWSFNLSRMSPIEFGFILIPDGKGGLVRKLPPHFDLPQEGDVVEWTEFGRSHPQIQAAYVDIMSSGEIDGYELPWVYNYATSNDRIFRSSAIKDRFMVSIAPDPRKNAEEATLIKKLIIEHAGLTPYLMPSYALNQMVTDIIGATYTGFGEQDNGAEVPAVQFQGISTRNVIGRLQQRAVDGPDQNTAKYFFDLIQENNRLALESAPQHYIVMPPSVYHGGTIKVEINKEYLRQFLELERTMEGFPPPVQSIIRTNRLYIERSLS